MNYPISINDRDIEVVATEGQTALDTDYPLLEGESVVVKRDRAGVVSTLAYPDDYTISGLNVEAGFTVDLVVGAADGDKYRIFGKAKLDRLSDFENAKGLPSGGINSDLDRRVMAEQEMQRDADRSLKLADFEGHYDALAKRVTNAADGQASSDLVSKAQLDGTAILAAEGFQFRGYYNVLSVYSGNGLVGDLVRSTADKNIYLAKEKNIIGLEPSANLDKFKLFISANTGSSFVFDTLSDVVSANIPEHIKHVTTLGHTIIADGGGYDLKRVESAPTHALKAQSADGAHWEASVKFVRPQMAGAFPDGVTDSRVLFQAAADAAIDLGVQLRFFKPASPWRIIAAVRFKSGADWLGEDWLNDTIKLTDDAHEDVNVVEPYNLDGSVTGCRFVCFRLNGHFSRGTVSGVGAQRPGSSGFVTGGAKAIYMDRVAGVDCVLHGIDICNGGEDDGGTLKYVTSANEAVDYYPANMSSDVVFGHLYAKNCGDDGITGHYSHGVTGVFAEVPTCGLRHPEAVASNPVELDDGIFNWRIDLVKGGGGNRSLAIKCHAGQPTPYDVSIGFVESDGSSVGIFMHDANDTGGDRRINIAGYRITNPAEVQAISPLNCEGIEVDAMGGVIIGPGHIHAVGDEAVNWGNAINLNSGANKPRIGFAVIRNWNPNEDTITFAAIRITSSVIAPNIEGYNIKNSGWLGINDSGSDAGYIGPGYMDGEDIAGSIGVWLNQAPVSSGTIVEAPVISGYETRSKYGTQEFAFPISYTPSNVMAKEGFSSGVLTIADNAAAVIATTARAGILFIWNYQSDFPQSLEAAIVSFDSADSPRLEPLILGPDVEVSQTAPVTGTDGTDGKITVGVAENELSIENRTGASTDVKYLLMV